MSEFAALRSEAGAVRLTLPARVANDLDGLQRTLAELAERTGHPSCATGCDTLFLQLERDFAVGEEVQLNPQPIPPGVVRRHVEVTLPARLTDDLDSLQKAIAVVADKLGCPSCCSGFDIAFRREVDLITLNENLEVQGFGRFS
jgi:hypothetical protein